jgi:GGDEF domain-containing protein
MAMAELDSDSDSDRLLQSFADLLVGATPHFRLTWFYIGEPDAELIRPAYCAGAERDWGLTVVYADREGYFDELGLEPFRALSRLVQVGLDRLRLQDALTGTPNRHGFERALEHRHRTAPRDWLLMQLDIDDFSALNAGGGEALGDAVLRELSARIGRFAGSDGLIGRSGADEFLLACARCAPHRRRKSCAGRPPAACMNCCMRRKANSPSFGWRKRARHLRPAHLLAPFLSVQDSPRSS